MLCHAVETFVAVPVFPLVTRGDPARGHDVRAVPLSLRNVEDLLFEQGIDICHETGAALVD